MAFLIFSGILSLAATAILSFLGYQGATKTIPELTFWLLMLGSIAYLIGARKQ